MATAVLTSVPSTISLAESVTGWTGNSFSLEPDIKKQGSNSVSCAQTTNGNNDVYYTGFTAANLNAVHLRLWFNISFVGNLATSNQIQVFISDGTNTAYWTIQNPGDYAGGWSQAVIYTANTPTSGTKPSGNSTRVGMRFVTSTKPRNVPANSWFDAWYYGDGYTVTGGTNGDEIDLSHIASLDKIQAYNIIERLDDVYFLAGNVIIGNGNTTTWFKSGQKIQFKDLPISSTLYGIDYVGSGCNVNITGGSIGAAGTRNYHFDASDTNVTFTMTGVQFAKCSSTTFAPGQTITACVFDNCGQVDPSTSAFNGITFSNSTDVNGACLFPSDDSNISDLIFINCDNGIEYNSSSDSTSPKFDDFKFDDSAGNYDVNNTSGSSVNIALVNGSNANSYNTSGSAVTFSASITIKFTITDEDTGSALQYARIEVKKASDKSALYQLETNVSGVATTTANYSGDTPVVGWVRQWDISGDDYTPKSFTGTIGTNGLDLSIALKKATLHES